MTSSISSSRRKNHQSPSTNRYENLLEYQYKDKESDMTETPQQFSNLQSAKKVYSKRDFGMGKEELHQSKDIDQYNQEHQASMKREAVEEYQSGYRHGQAIGVYGKSNEHLDTVLEFTQRSSENQEKTSKMVEMKSDIKMLQDKIKNLESKIGDKTIQKSNMGGHIQEESKNLQNKLQNRLKYSTLNTSFGNSHDYLQNSQVLPSDLNMTQPLFSNQPDTRSMSILDLQSQQPTVQNYILHQDEETLRSRNETNLSKFSQNLPNTREVNPTYHSHRDLQSQYFRSKSHRSLQSQSSLRNRSTNSVTDYNKIITNLKQKLQKVKDKNRVLKQNLKQVKMQLEEDRHNLQQMRQNYTNVKFEFGCMVDKVTQMQIQRRSEIQYYQDIESKYLQLKNDLKTIGQGQGPGLDYNPNQAKDKYMKREKSVDNIKIKIIKNSKNSSAPKNRPEVKKSKSKKQGLKLENDNLTKRSVSKNTIDHLRSKSPKQRILPSRNKHLSYLSNPKMSQSAMKI